MIDASYVGLILGARFADFGHDLTGIAEATQDSDKLDLDPLVASGATDGHIGKN
ncbi:hypothetical protein [Bradyrhizobium cenepequi]